MDDPNTTPSRIRGTALSADGTAIAYERQGDGPPVILVSGALATAATDAPLAALLAHRFSVFTYDRRGRGASGDTAPYAVEREIEDLAAVVGEAGGTASVHGMASGGALVLEAAAAGLPITQLSVYEPPFLTDPAGRRASAARRARLDGLLAADRRTDALELFLADVVPPGTLGRLKGSPVWGELESLAHTLAYDHAVLGDALVPTVRLREVTARVMVVDGGASPGWQRETVRAISEALPRGRHRTLTGQTHQVAPHVLAPVLEDYFAA
ncbi:alpha/beta fold hydrolase [Streptomyces sp. FIT100]|uniref:alpha/beta fold hydrolase n=1 Tax=Streptomyces sp. FIT100 TaxID=2837956 RepID=UPI0021C6BB62|nr:alpha/beta hydrolase [Streptomyces sp. FIT100]UUN29306.1 alpha/beta fold hydrolase [Streptomyces sp. FIT100]